LQILTRVRALTTADDPVLWRQVMFSSLPLTGYWRYRGEWQIVPVPEDAPKPEFLMAEHPFFIEVRGVGTGDSRVDGVRALRRLWQLQMILSVALWVSISNSDRSPTHVWVLGDVANELRPEYRQLGYFVPNLTAPANDFTTVVGLEPVPTINDHEYFSRRGSRVTLSSTFLRSCRPYSTATPQPLQPTKTHSFARAIG
jgi:hypothetical protein